MHARDLLSIGELARRAGTSVSAIRFYEQHGLLAALRSAGNQRRFLRADIRRVAFILIAQGLGLTLTEIRAELDGLPGNRTPNGEDWDRIARHLRDRIDAQIETLQRTRERLGDCIGCGCLSLQRCALYNARDKAAQRGAGPRYLLGDRPGDIADAPE
jgi:MerR family redox-sensitive transcriptional activator SoxR